MLNKPSIIDGPGTMASPKIYVSPKGRDMKLSPTRGHLKKYMHNGQGRDSYIYDTNGGFTAPHVVNPGNKTFFNQLRSYDKSPHNPSINRNLHNRSPSMQNLSPQDRVNRMVEDFMLGTPINRSSINVDHF